MARRGRDVAAADVADVDAARAIERQMDQLRGRVQRGGVMEYLKPLGTGERKDVNKVFLSSTIRSVDFHNRRHEEEKCWKIRELERKLDDRHHHRRARSRSTSRSASPGRRRHGRDRRRDGSRIRSRSRGRRSDDRDRRRRSRSRSRSGTLRSSGDQRKPSIDQATAADTSDAEREYWAAKKAEKTKKMWEAVHAGATTVVVANAPAFSSEDDSDDEDERVHDASVQETKHKKKAKKHKKDKKHKRSKDDRKKRK